MWVTKGVEGSFKVYEAKGVAVEDAVVAAHVQVFCLERNSTAADCTDAWFLEENRSFRVYCIRLAGGVDSPCGYVSPSDA